jgi:hypothetical protein
VSGSVAAPPARGAGGGLVAALVLGGGLVAALGWVLGLAPAVGVAGRWTLVAGSALWAWRRRSLTAWILVSMLVGARSGTTSRPSAWGCGC